MTKPTKRQIRAAIAQASRYLHRNVNLDPENPAHMLTHIAITTLITAARSQLTHTTPRGLKNKHHKG